MRLCHLCPFNGLSSDQCLSCASDEQYRFYNPYIDETFENIEEPDTDGSSPVTNLDEEDEDRLRKALYEIFDLSYTELMMIKSIMNSQSLTKFAQDMEQLGPSISSYSRFRAFQTRKAIARKLPWIKDALMTSGQRRKIR